MSVLIRDQGRCEITALFDTRFYSYREEDNRLGHADVTSNKHPATARTSIFPAEKITPAEGSAWGGRTQRRPLTESLRAPVSPARPRAPESARRATPTAPPGTLPRGRAGKGAERAGAARTRRQGSGRGAAAPRPRGAAAPQRGEAPRGGPAPTLPPSVCLQPALHEAAPEVPAEPEPRAHLVTAPSRPNAPVSGGEGATPTPAPGRATAGGRLATAEEPAPLQSRQSKRRCAGERHEKRPMDHEHLGKLTGSGRAPLD